MLNTIEEALAELRSGRPVLVADDADDVRRQRPGALLEEEGVEAVAGLRDHDEGALPA